MTDQEFWMAVYLARLRGVVEITVPSTGRKIGPCESADIAVLQLRSRKGDEGEFSVNPIASDLLGGTNGH